MALTFYGALAGISRTTVVPSRLAGVTCRLAEFDSEEWFARCADLPEVTKRAWLWLALSVRGHLSPQDVQANLSFGPGGALHPNRDDRSNMRLWSLHRVENLRLAHSEWNIDQIASIHRQCVDVHSQGFRSQSVRFGSAANDSVFSHGINWQDVPRFVEELCSFVRQSPIQSLEHAIIAFRQLILIHPFADGNGRLARILSCLMCNAGDWPRHILLPGLMSFAAGSRVRNRYSTALGASCHTVFVRHMMRVVQSLLDSAGAEASSAMQATQHLSHTLSRSSNGRKVVRRMVKSACITATEFARLMNSSNSNGIRWLKTLRDEGLFHEDGERWWWTPISAMSERMFARLQSDLDVIATAHSEA